MNDKKKKAIKRRAKKVIGIPGNAKGKLGVAKSFIGMNPKKSLWRNVIDGFFGE